MNPSSLIRSQFLQFMRDRNFSTQTALARASGTSVPTVNFMSIGILPKRQEDLEKIARALLLTPAELCQLIHQFMLTGWEQMVQVYEPEPAEEVAFND